MFLLINNLHEKRIVESQDPFLANQKKGGGVSYQFGCYQLNQIDVARGQKKAFCSFDYRELSKLF